MANRNLTCEKLKSSFYSSGYAEIAVCPISYWLAAEFGCESRVCRLLVSVCIWIWIASVVRFICGFINYSIAAHATDDQTGVNITWHWPGGNTMTISPPRIDVLVLFGVTAATLIYYRLEQVYLILLNNKQHQV